MATWVRCRTEPKRVSLPGGGRRAARWSWRIPGVERLPIAAGAYDRSPKAGTVGNRASRLDAHVHRSLSLTDLEAVVEYARPSATASRPDLAGSDRDDPAGPVVELAVPVPVPVGPPLAQDQLPVLAGQGRREAMPRCRTRDLDASAVAGAAPRSVAYRDILRIMHDRGRPVASTEVIRRNAYRVAEKLGMWLGQHWHPDGKGARWDPPPGSGATATHSTDTAEPA